MAKITVPFSVNEPDFISQVQYAITFASEDILSYRICEEQCVIECDLREGAEEEVVVDRINRLLSRYGSGAFGFKSNVYFEQQIDLPVIDAWSQLLEKRWVVPVGQGHVILRGLAASLMDLIDTRVRETFVKEFDAELEVYPSTILSRTLDKCNHFSSFPEHIDFVAHLRQDLDVLNTFARACRENGWDTALHDGHMDGSDLSISPSCCYHCYEGMEGWTMKKPGRCVTAVLNCHRYEGANHTTLSRLRSFTMRELVWVGHPKYVTESRARAEQMIVEWARDWELSCILETANDMFFTDDFSVKASFQRQQEAKRELRATIPFENQSISIFSSNFHSGTFGKAFNISVDGRQATSGCIGWGYERWVYAIFSQFGLDLRLWPIKLRAEIEAHLAKGVGDAHS